MIAYRPIGILRTPFFRIDDMPIQPCSDMAAAGTAVIDAGYRDAVAGLHEFSHVILLYHLHRQSQVLLTVRPFSDPRPRGVFATRAPARPNPIGLSVVPLLAVDGLELRLDRLDMLDGTPLLDIKPYVPMFDRIEAASAGWFAGVANLEAVRADRRFAPGAAEENAGPRPDSGAARADAAGASSPVPSSYSQTKTG